MKTIDVSVNGPVEAWFDTAKGYVDDHFAGAPGREALIAAYVQACSVVALREALTDEVVAQITEVADGVAAVRAALEGRE